MTKLNLEASNYEYSDNNGLIKKDEQFGMKVVNSEEYRLFKQFQENKQKYFNNHLPQFQSQEKFNWELLVEEWIKYADLQSSETEKTYKSGLKQFLKFLVEHHILRPNREDILDWKKELRSREIEANSINIYIISCRQFFMFLGDQNIYPDIFKGIKLERVSDEFKKDALTEIQLTELLSSVDTLDIKGKRDYAMLILMGTRGLRDVEVMRANIEDMRYSGSQMVLYIQGKGRVAKDKLVPLNEPQERAIRAYLMVRNTSDLEAPLFVSTSNNNLGKRLSTRTISGVAKAAMRKIGLNTKRYTAHSLRHTAATIAARAGAKDEETQLLLRHSNPATTQKYKQHQKAEVNNAALLIDEAVFTKMEKLDL